jgi:hypothetical protein
MTAENVRFLCYKIGRGLELDHRTKGDSLICQERLFEDIKTKTTKIAQIQNFVLLIY